MHNPYKLSLEPKNPIGISEKHINEKITKHSYMEYSVLESYRESIKYVIGHEGFGLVYTKNLSTIKVTETLNKLYMIIPVNSNIDIKYSNSPLITVNISNTNIKPGTYQGIVRSPKEIKNMSIIIVNEGAKDYQNCHIKEIYKIDENAYIFRGLKTDIEDLSIPRVIKHTLEGKIKSGFYITAEVIKSY